MSLSRAHMHCIWLLAIAFVALKILPADAFDFGSALGGLLGRRSSSSSSSPPPSSTKNKKGKDELEPVSDDKAKNYLQQFGYIGPSQLIGGKSVLAADLSDVKNIFKEAIWKFQEFAGLTPTGELDQRTKKKMAEPRCGLIDVQAITSSGSEPLYKWPKQRLTYTILSYSPDLPQRDITAAIKRAFQIWSEKSPLDFEEISGSNADIKIKFEGRDHGDPWPFDGKGGVLAHATMPTSGMLHFDEDENWVYMDANKIANYHFTDLLPVAIHEIGHTLGLSHSKVEDSIMAPFYQETVDSDGKYVMPTLQPADIKAIQAIYGPRRGGNNNSGRGSRRGGLFGFSGFTDDTDDFGGRNSFGRSDGSRDTQTTTERTSTKSFFGSLWSSWLGNGRSSSRSRSRSDDENGDVNSGSRGDSNSNSGSRGDSNSNSGRDSSSFGSTSGRSSSSDNDSGFSGGSGAADCPRSIDAFTPGPGGVSYIFQGSKVYELRGKSLQRVHSLRILFINGPIYVEAALVNPRQQTIALFQSYNVYVFEYDGSTHKFRLVPGHPKRVNGFNPVGAMVWSDGHQFLFSRNGEFAVYDDYWNEVQAVNRLPDYFPGFPATTKGGMFESGMLTAFTSERVYRYDINRRSIVGSSQSISSYLGC